MLPGPQADHGAGRVPGAAGKPFSVQRQRESRCPPTVPRRSLYGRGHRQFKTNRKAGHRHPEAPLAARSAPPFPNQGPLPACGRHHDAPGAPCRRSCCPLPLGPAAPRCPVLSALTTADCSGPGLTPHLRARAPHLPSSGLCRGGSAASTNPLAAPALLSCTPAPCVSFAFSPPHPASPSCPRAPPIPPNPAQRKAHLNPRPTKGPGRKGAPLSERRWSYCPHPCSPGPAEL